MPFVNRSETTRRPSSDFIAAASISLQTAAFHCIRLLHCKAHMRMVYCGALRRGQGDPQCEPLSVLLSVRAQAVRERAEQVAAIAAVTTDAGLNATNASEQA
jgi:hypothetical protein